MRYREIIKKKTFTNELGNKIKVRVTRFRDDRKEPIRVELIGPDSTSENNITKQEARVMASLTKSALDEAKSEVVEVYGYDVRVWKSPSHIDFVNILQMCDYEARFSIDNSGDLYLWDASRAIHNDIEVMCDIHGVEYRGLMRTDRVKIEWEVDEDNFRNIKSVARAYGNWYFDIENDSALEDEDYQDLDEARSPTAIYYHITPAKNVPSILKHGLIPNHANEGTGRYEDTRWQTLEGIYATNNSGLANNIAGQMDGPFAIVVLSVSPKSTLPDEDVIEILARQCYETALDLWGIDTHFYHTPSEYFDHLADDPDRDDTRPDPTIDDVWKTAREEFHKRASRGNRHIPYNDALLDQLFDYWSTHGVEEYEGGDNDPSVWMDIKDKISKLYRHNMNAGSFTDRASIRIEDRVTFRGRNRIVAIVTGSGSADIVYGKPTPEMESFISSVY